MFFPFKLNLPIFKKLQHKPVSHRFVLRSLMIVLFLMVGVQIAHQLKTYSINSLSSKEVDNTLYVSIFKGIEIDEVIHVLQLNDTISKRKVEGKHIVYILPADMYISELPMQEPDKQYNHMRYHDYDFTKLKVVYTKPMGEKLLKGDHVLFNTKQLIPLREIRLDIDRHVILSIQHLNMEQINYKNIPQPVF